MAKKNDNQDTIYHIRRELKAVVPDIVIDPLPPQPSIIKGPSMRVYARAFRKIVRATRNRSDTANKSFSWLEDSYKQLQSGDPRKTVKKISFSTHRQPSVSIVIPVYNKFPLTIECLASLQSNISENINYEVIVVDNASSDASHNLANTTGLVYIRNKENEGFVGGCNIGAAKARGKYLVFLNNDALVCKNWLESLVSTLESSPVVGLVGSKIIYPDGRLQEAGGIIYKDGSGSNYGKNDHPDRYQYNFLREVDYCSGASIIIEKVLFDEFGGFDELYAPAYYEDTDLAFKVRKKGLKVMYQPESVIYHIEGATAGTSTTSGFKKYQDINHKKFLKRWKKELETQHFTATDSFRARDRNAQKTVLIVDEHIPKPDEDSGSVRMSRMIEAYQELGYKVVFFPNFSKKQPKYMRPLQQRGVEVMYGEVRLADWLMDNGYYLDIVMLSRPRIGSFYIDLCKALCPNAKIIYDTVDLHYLRLRRQAEYESGDMKKYLTDMADKHELLEKYLLRQADVGLVVSDLEVKELSKSGLKNIQILSNIHEIQDAAYDVPFEARKNLLFVGGFAHLPNVDAIKWFVSNIFPSIVKQADSIKLLVVGSQMPDDLRKYLSSKKNVEVLGFVENLDPVLKSVRVFVAPLRYGAGVKGKIGQAIEYGIPVVSTGLGLEGMKLTANKSCVVADDSNAFAKQVLKLYADKDLWRSIQSDAKDVLEANFSKEKTIKDLRQILAKKS